MLAITSLKLLLNSSLNPVRSGKLIAEEILGGDRCHLAVQLRDRMRKYLNHWTARCNGDNRPNSGLREFVDFSGEDEIAFGEAVDFVRPDFDAGFAPGK